MSENACVIFIVKQGINFLKQKDTDKTDTEILCNCIIIATF
jgi:hypothetical protein